MSVFTWLEARLTLKELEARVARLETAHTPKHLRPVDGCPGCDAALAEKMHEPVTESREP